MMSLCYLSVEVVTRWWSTFTSLPYPDRIALKLISYIPGKVTVGQFGNLILDFLYSGSLSKEFKTSRDAVCEFVNNPRLQTRFKKGILFSQLGQDLIGSA